MKEYDLWSCISFDKALKCFQTGLQVGNPPPECGGISNGHYNTSEYESVSLFALVKVMSEKEKLLKNFKQTLMIIVVMKIGITICHEYVALCLARL